MPRKKAPRTNYDDLSTKYYDNADLKILLKISDATIWRWRKNKILHFVKIGGKYYYRRKFINKLMEERNA